jgi:thymidylate synthase (FAD)
MITADNLPIMSAVVYWTLAGTQFLREPGVAMLSVPAFSPTNLKPFLSGFDTSLGYGEYLLDGFGDLSAADGLIKVAGQLCYMSFDKERTHNKDIKKYLTNIKSSGHGSVLEHPNFSFLLWGISRSLTHELVRHRAGVAYSQLSQRYVSGKALRFVERPEYQNDLDLHEWFCDRIDLANKEYHRVAERLIAMQAEGNQLLSGEKKRDLRKKVNQCARSVLPNETETAMVFTANGRALRHIIEMRAAGAAEVEIRKLSYKLYRCVKLIAPELFDDYELEQLPDGTPGLKTPYRKV